MRGKAFYALSGALVVGSLSVNSLLALPKKNYNGHCKQAIARVMSTGDQRWPTGTPLCAGDRIQPVGNKDVTVLCLASEKLIFSASGDAGSLCLQNRKKTPLRRNADGTVRLNFRGHLSAKRIKSPYGNVLMDGRPTISWRPVDTATEYRIRVQGYGLDWKRSVSGATTINYPESEPPLKSGLAYRITVLAYAQNQSLGHSASSYQTLQPEDFQQIQMLERVLADLNLPVSEEAINKDALYMSYKLLDNTIKSLESAVEHGADRRVVTLLRKRYIQAGVPEEANKLAANRDIIASSQTK